MPTSAFKFLNCTVEECSKIIAATLVAVYVVGYAVLTLYFARFGFAQNSLLRPRVLEVGSACVILTAIPVAIGIALDHIPSSHLTTKRRMFLKFFLIIPIAQLALNILEVVGPRSSGIDPQAINPVRLSLISLVVTLLLALMVFFAYVLAKNYRRLYKTWLVTLMFVSTSIAYIHIRYWQDVPSHIFWWWCSFILIALIYRWMVAKAEEKEAHFIAAHPYEAGIIPKHRNLAEHYRFWMLLTPACSFLNLIMFISAYTLLLFPSIPYSAGGGSKVNVVIYLKNSRLNFLKGAMIDESDYGYFLLPSGAEKAFFVPRGDIEGIDFNETRGLTFPVSTEKNQAFHP